MDIKIYERWIQGFPTVELITRFELLGKSYIFQISFDPDQSIGQCLDDFQRLALEALRKKEGELAQLSEHVVPSTKDLKRSKVIAPHK